MYLWNTNRLALALANRELSAEDKFKYLLASYVMYGGATYADSLFVVGSGGWLYWYEAFMVVVLTWFGLIRCKTKYIPAHGDSLLENCVVLGLPLGLKLLLFTWAAHYSCRTALTWAVRNISLLNERGTELVPFALQASIIFYPFVIAVLGTAWYYWRLSAHLQTSSQPSVIARFAVAEEAR